MTNDLPEKERKVVRYINLYTSKEVGTCHNSRKEADSAVDPLRTRVGCNKVEFVEGKFDE